MSEALRAALAGHALNTDELETCAMDPEYTSKERDVIVPLIVELAETRPEIAAEIPEALIRGLFRNLTFERVCELTGLGTDSLNNKLIRPLMLGQFAVSSDALAASNRPFAQAALQLLADEQLETASVTSLETLLRNEPGLADLVPFDTLFNSESAELRARLMAVNTLLLRGGVQNRKYLGIKLEDAVGGDPLLLSLQIDYIGELVGAGVGRLVAPLCFELAALYTNKNRPQFFTHGLEAALAAVAKADESLFMELETLNSLVDYAVENKLFGLLARIPPQYLVKHHQTVVSNLEARSGSIEAVANLAQDPVALRLLPLSALKLRALPAQLQLMLAACATATNEGAHYFQEVFGDCLQAALMVPYTETSAEMHQQLRDNMRRWGLRQRRIAEVSTAV